VLTTSDAEARVYLVLVAVLLVLLLIASLVAMRGFAVADRWERRAQHWMDRTRNAEAEVRRRNAVASPTAQMPAYRPPVGASGAHRDAT